MIRSKLPQNNRKYTTCNTGELRSQSPVIKEDTASDQEESSQRDNHEMGSGSKSQQEGELVDPAVLDAESLERSVRLNGGSSSLRG